MGRAFAKPIICLSEFDGFRFALPILRACLFRRELVLSHEHCHAALTDAPNR
jgi:hypothetical protein